jgi:fatty acid desaturase
VLLAARSWWEVAFAALLFGLALGQVASFTHDCGHRAVLPAGRANDALGLLFGNLVGGVSWNWWRDKHNAHHAHPNDLELDPDVNIKLVALAPEQVALKRGIARWVTRHQAALFVFLLPFEAMHFQLAGVKHLLRARARYRWIELSLLALRTLLLVGGLLVALPASSAVIALIVSEASLGIFFGSIFAPNHKGMPPPPPDADYLRRQVVTARNVRPNPLLDFWFIGLNYQIEHHLFPTLARNKLGAARVIVRRFCAERGIPYAEVGFVQSWVEIVRGLAVAAEGVSEREPAQMPAAQKL